MLETTVADVLNKVLGDFVLNVQADQLNVAIWNGRFTFIISFLCCSFDLGNVVLKELQLKTDALSSLLDLPVDIQQGS